MANRWERGKLGPYNMPQDFTEGGVGLAGINNIKNKPDPFLVPVGTLFHSNLRDIASGTSSSSFVRPSGQQVSRQTYSNLFGLIGTVFGSGDGSTTFNLPSLNLVFSRAQGAVGTSGVLQLQPSQFTEHTHVAATLTNSVTYRTLQGLNSYDGTIAPNATRTAVGPFSQRSSLFEHNSVSTVGDDTRNSGVKITGGVIYPAYFNETLTALPIGAIVPFIGSDDLSPFGANWLLCNGQTVNPALYPSAASVGLTVTPDLRGFFLGASSNNAASYATGPTGVPGHRHLQSDGNASITPPIASGNYWINYSPSWPVENASPIINVSSTSASLGPGNETRPINVSVNYFIRVN